jgi:hypothetical protein
VDIPVGGRDRGADVLRLTGDSLGAEPTAVQGAAVDRSGHLKPGRPDQARVHNGSLGVDLGAGSAVVITIDC